MDRDELLALAERVEALTGPDRGVAKLIFAAVYPDGIPKPVVTSGYGWREDESGWWLQTGEDDRVPRKTVYPPNWLASLDAAMSLVPEGVFWGLDANAAAVVSFEVKYGPNEFGEVEYDRETLNVFAATPALALTAAALRALAAQQPSGAMTGE